jgi:hypothetical protein
MSVSAKYVAGMLMRAFGDWRQPRRPGWAVPGTPGLGDWFEIESPEGERFRVVVERMPAPAAPSAGLGGSE